MKKVYSRPASLKQAPFHYCPGCGHSIIHRLVAELIDEMSLRGKAICIPPAGCAVLAYNYFDIDVCESAHGRGCAVATGFKRAQPDRFVFTYQGDGDMAAIGTAETIHAANRGELITSIFVNNAVYGMTGGQMAPTTMLGQKTTTSPYGRRPKIEGYPLLITNLIAQLNGAAYVVRTSLATPAKIMATKKALKKAFEIQLEGLGYTLVEVLSPCPTNWKMTPVEAFRYLEERMEKEYPLGVFKDITKD
ncbi:MAG TPA: thiamine pyrophosphate-dependent enzyme [Deltaproteobacteria bacterium]|jgi:2-oxoglutarate ferredoxin oxidoreductase subunit beta|nr:2-oxoglutarate oxidoreductase [Deltaproteobacteria bacterium]OQC23839.1 MAG: 2-oxoglutarate oxidoreductase subunit KorB [Deltaproteobacteria bacterium ADurb.Bin072]HRW79500.1 thiamine pyrophosphate-dependent enzyme [Desulfomonilia bacterium]HNQ85281.1 thiamine pyrophosphate-dependent enzyme [Deltaproteobacteria bacterium]HNS89554.1 thiamine pyrophosphate-dependent enzyme [Deltaproteobacteria bacterium]